MGGISRCTRTMFGSEEEEEEEGISFVGVWGVVGGRNTKMAL